MHAINYIKASRNVLLKTAEIIYLQNNHGDNNSIVKYGPACIIFSNAVDFSKMVEKRINPHKHNTRSIFGVDFGLCRII